MFMLKIAAALAGVAATVAVLLADVRNDQLPRPVPLVDLTRYAGRWYEVARYPNSFQKDCRGETTADYTLRSDGEIDVVNRCRARGDRFTEARGRARVADRRQSSKLEVRFAPASLAFLPFVWGDYWVLDLGADYEYAVVGEPRRKLLWILSRTPEIDEGVYAGITERLAAQGYSVDRLVRTGTDSITTAR